MSKRSIVIALLVCLVLGLSGGSYVAYRWFTRDQPAMGVYRMEFPEGMDFSEGVAKVEEVMESDLVVKKVVKDLNLVERFKVKNEEEAVARVRAKLSLRPLQDAGRVRVMYRDRKYQQSLEILKAVHEEFAKTRAARSVLRPPEE